jgi:PBP1b-binding outer membrane lipoprotein LpoB
MRTLPILLVVISTIFLAGCAEAPQATAAPKKKAASKKAPKPQMKKPSTTKVLIDGFTGKTAIGHLKKTKVQIKQIEDLQQERLDGIKDFK